MSERQRDGDDRHQWLDESASPWRKAWNEGSMRGHHDEQGQDPWMTAALAAGDQRLLIQMILLLRRGKLRA